MAAALVSITAHDPKRARARNNAFSVSKDGCTTLSASGASFETSAVLSLHRRTQSPPIVLDVHQAFQFIGARETLKQYYFDPGFILASHIVTTAAAFQPFLHGNTSDTRHLPKLVSDARVEVRIAGHKVDATTVAAVKVPAIAAAAAGLLTARVSGGTGAFRWNLTPRDAAQCDVSLVLLISCELPAHVVATSCAAAPQSPAPLQQGSAIHAVGSPFGATAPDHFADLRSDGIVSGVIQDGQTPALLLADLRVLPGCEGGPVFDSTSGALVGMLLMPLCVKGYELPVVAPVAALVEAIGDWGRRRPSGTWQPPRSPPVHTQPACERHPTLDNSVTPAPAYSLAMVPQSADAPWDCKAVRKAALSIVGVVLSNGQWASGVLVNRQGVVITNAHLFDEPSQLAASGRDAHISVAVYSDAGQRWHSARLLRIFTGKGALDIAIVQLAHLPATVQPVLLSKLPPASGTQCFVGGCALFHPGAISPLLTRGHVAQSLELPNGNGRSTPAMLLTTAAVHSGASGGAVLDVSGQLLGLVTSNARHASGKTIPHLNFSIAAAWLRPLWQHLQHSQDTDTLPAFDSADVELVRLWSLRPFRVEYEARLHSKL